MKNNMNNDFEVKIISDKKIKVSIEEILSIRKRCKEINSVKLNDIEFTFDGKIINPSLEDIEHWYFTGLNNIDFVRCILEGEYIPLQNIDD
jgi:hypothetical protein